jgi:hypothetical protein
MDFDDIARTDRFYQIDLYHCDMIHQGRSHSADFGYYQ